MAVQNEQFAACNIILILN